MSLDKDRVYGAAAGHALGDALGAPFEFFRNPQKPEYHGTIEYEPGVPSRWHGWRYGVVGQVTDDSEMARALLNLLDYHGYDRDKAIHSYQAWSNSKPIGQGKNTAALFRGISTVRSYEKRRATISPSESNGSLMRCWPLALISDETKRNEALLMDCDLTNPTDVNRNASQVYLAALRAALEGKSKKDIQTIVLKEATREKVRKTVENALRVPGALLTSLPDCDTQPYDINSKNKGWVLVALYTSLYYFFLGTSYHEVIDSVIRQGGDTDTNAAIAGALAGAYWGFDAMMSHPTTKQNWELVQKAPTHQGTFPRPTHYHPGRLLVVVDHVLQSMELQQQQQQKRKAREEIDDITDRKKQRV